jgi:methyl-accepting chemotaxis protein
MNLSLRQTYALFAGVLLVLGAATVACSIQAGRAAAVALDVSAQRYQSYLLADELRQSSDDLTRLARTYVISGDAKWERQYLQVLDIRNGKLPRPLRYERIYWDFRAANDGYDGGQDATIALDTLMKQAGFTSQEFAKLKEAADNSNELVSTETIAMNMVKGLYDDGKGGFTRRAEPNREKAAEMMHGLGYHQAKAKIMAPVNQFLAMVDERTRGLVEAATRQSEWWSRMAMASVLTLVLSLCAMLWWTRRETLGILSTIGARCRTIATGDLAQDIPVAGCAEGRQILGELRQMQERLRGTILEVRQTADSIATGAREIANGSSDLSQRTEEQAANLEQTAASMEQLTTTVQQSARNAVRANALSDTAAAAAASGGNVVGQVVARMEAITDSSRRIADIIGVIDGIAFQTNILALNAAVEAARAGEQGRGFAVVAGEVRTLAQRSADAAKEIRLLIGKSVEEIHSGSELVGKAGASMEEIVSKARSVTGLIGEISTASQEQSSGIGQVGNAVTQMDQVTQQNAALVEQLAASADSLKEQAVRLTRLMSSFRLEHA